MTQVVDRPALQHGFVQGRFVTAIADTLDDEDRYPDLQGVQGNVRFEPVAPIHMTEGAHKATVIKQPVVANINSEGYVVDVKSAGDALEVPGVWLAVGRYNVHTVFNGSIASPGFTIEVTAEHTKESPLHLTDAAPIVLPPASVEVTRVIDRILAQQAAAEAMTAASVAAQDAAALVRDEVSADALTASTSATQASTVKAELEAIFAGGTEAVNDAAVAQFAGTEGTATRVVLNETIGANIIGLKVGDAYVADRLTRAPWYNRPEVTTASGSQISGGAFIAASGDYTGDTKFRYNGTYAVTKSGDWVTSTQDETKGAPYITPEFVTDAADLEIRVREGRTGGIGFRVIVDDKLTDDSWQMRRVTGTTSNTRHVRLTFPDRRVRHIKFEHDFFVGFAGVVASTHSIFMRPSRPYRNKHVVIGDSLNRGTHVYDYNRGETHGWLTSFLLGADFYMNLAVGGTGWKATSNTFATRVMAALAVNPTDLYFYGSRNDQSAIDSGAETHSSIRQAVISTLTSVKDVPNVVVTGSAQAGYDAISDTIRQGTVAAGRTYVDINGATAAPKDSPMAHPTLAEQHFLGQQVYALLDRVVLESRSAAATLAATVGGSTPPPALFGVVDSFNRANGLVGSSEDGKVWQFVNDNRWVIQDNALASPEGKGFRWAHVNTGSMFGVHEFTPKGEFSTGYMFCFAFRGGSHHLYVDFTGTSGGPRLHSRINWSSSSIAQGTAGASWAAGEAIAITVEPVSGTSLEADVTVRKNGSVILAKTRVNIAPYEAATNIGFGLSDLTPTNAALDRIESKPLGA